MSRSPYILSVSEATVLEQKSSTELRRYLALEPKHDAQDVFMRSAAPFLTMVGPNMIGKSPIGFMRMAMHASHVVPHAFRGRVPALLPMSHRGRHMIYVVLGITKEQAMDAAWGTLVEWLPPEFCHASSTKYRIVLRQFVDEPGRPIPRVVDKPGGVFALRTAEQKRKRQQGAPRIKIVWADEEDGNEGVIDEYQTQIAKVGGWLQLTATPVESLEKGGQTVFAQTVLDPAFAARHAGERSVWLDDDVQVVFGQRGDQIDGTTGRLMTPEQLAALDKKYRRESVRRLRVDGAWEPTPDRPYYEDRAIASVRLLDEETVERTGSIVRSPTGALFMPHPDGFLRIYDDADATDAVAIGADFAQGQARDRTAFVGWNRRTPRVAFVYHAHVEVEIAEEVLLALALYYQHAAVAIDPDRFGAQAIKHFRDARKSGLLYRTRTNPKDPRSKRRGYGYTFTSQSRAALDERIGEELNAGGCILRYKPLLDEIRVYGYYGREKSVAGGKTVDIPDHPRAGHDDLQKALGMALIAHDQEPLPRARTPEDRRYEQATGSERRVLDFVRKRRELFERVGAQQGHPGLIDAGNLASLRGFE